MIPITELSEISSSTLSALEDCSEESVYAPGYIQPYGMVLVLQPDLKIAQISENVELFLGISAEELLNRPLQQIFSRTQVKRMAAFLQQDLLEYCNPFELRVQRGLTANYQASHSPSHRSAHQPVQKFRATLHRTDETLILELEPLLKTKSSRILQVYNRLQTVILKLRNANSTLDLAQLLAREIKGMTGFDRIMVYRFAGDDHGVVIAEEKQAHLLSYLGLHYPATDIPLSARTLFCRNWIRQIPDINYTPVAFLSASPTDSSLNLSDCVLRGVSPYHVEYLQNMGVASSLTIALIDDKRLWGLIACHHDSPRLIDYETRKTCEFIGQFASVELVHQQERELSKYQMQVKAIQDKLQQAFLQEPNFMQQILMHSAVDLLDLVHATGIAIALDQQITLAGQTPPTAAVQDLLTWLLQLHPSEFYFTDCLSRPYPPAKAFKKTASGILAISIVLHQKSYHLIWFRSEQIQTVNWAGNLHDTIKSDEQGNLYLCPRKSFELWKETVQATSLPWQSAEVEAALMMRNTLLLAVLEFSQAALEQAAERAAIANRAKSQFLAKMSHELRTPLNAILGFTQVMNRSPNISAEFQEHLGIINRSGEHLLTLINDVLEMSKIEAGQLILNESCFNLSRLIWAIWEMFALKASEKQIILKVEKDRTIPEYICGDEAKLRQILINLMSNAIKFTQDGRITLSISSVPNDSTSLILPEESVDTSEQTANKQRELVTLQFAVADTGCGIAAADVESIFEAFMQTERGRHATGTGLGLSISRQFARLMGGDIEVNSIPNQGSTFICQVNFHLPETFDFVKTENSHRISSLEPGQPTYRILVVEDVPENQQLMVTLLQSVGFEVKIASNGAEAIEQWQSWQPDLIFMDIEMPVMNGYESTQHIRLQELEIQRQPVPIIALTAYAFESDRAATIHAGCNEHIRKPFNEATIFETIAHHLGVRYHYQEETQELIRPVQKLLSPEDFQVMPIHWIAQVHEAALDLNDGKIHQLIGEIPRQEESLIESITHLVNNFQLEVISILTKL